MVSYEKRREKGFIDVDGYGNEDELYSWCVSNRLILRKVYDEYEEVLYGKDRRPIVMQGKFSDFDLYKIGIKREIILTDGEVPQWVKDFSEKEREWVKGFTKRTRDKKGKRGGFLGGSPPYGYYNVNKKLHVDDYESFVVKFVYYRYSMGCKPYGIAKELNLRGFRNRNGNEFQTISIENILKNKRIYQGYLTFEGKEIKAEFRGILEDTEELLTEEWKNRVFDSAVEARITEHRKKYHSENSVPNEIKPYITIGTEPKKKTRRNK